MTVNEEKITAAQKKRNELLEEQKQYSEEAIQVAKQLMKLSGYKPQNDLLTMNALAAEYDLSKDPQKVLSLLSDKMMGSRSFEYLKEIAPVTYEILTTLQTVSKIKYNKEDVEAFGDAWQYVQKAVGKTKLSLKSGIGFDEIDFSKHVQNEIYKETNDIVSGLSRIINEELDLVNGSQRVKSFLTDSFLQKGFGEIINKNTVSEVEIIVRNVDELNQAIANTELNMENVLKILDQIQNSSSNFTRGNILDFIDSIVEKSQLSESELDNVIQRINSFATSLVSSTSQYDSQVLLDQELAHQSSMYKSLAKDIQDTISVRKQQIETDEEYLSLLNQLSEVQSSFNSNSAYKRNNFWKEEIGGNPKPPTDGIFNSPINLNFTTGNENEEKLFDTLNREIGSLNRELLIGTKLIEEGTNKILTLFYVSEEIPDKLAGGIKGQTFSTIPLSLIGNEKMTQWYGNIEKIYKEGLGLSVEEVEKVITDYFI